MSVSPTPPPQRTLYLIDGYSQIFRAYYAIMSPMTSPRTGEPTNVAFGLSGVFIKLLRDFHPHYVIMAVDLPGPGFREELYAQYKANRDSTPADLTQQIPRALQMSELFGIPVVGFSGAEADDVIATLTRRMLSDPDHQDFRVRIVSKDKDLEQLLGPRVEMFDIHTDEVIDAARLMQKKGVRPEQVIDLLSLTGDTADNVPGVPGIGPKTAASLLQEFGTVEGIYAHLDQIKGKKRENLEASRESLALARKLVTLKDDLPIPFDLGRARVGRMNVPALGALFEELGLRRAQADLEKLAKTLGPAEPEPEAFPTSLFGWQEEPAPERARPAAAQPPKPAALPHSAAPAPSVQPAASEDTEAAQAQQPSGLLAQASEPAVPVTTAADFSYSAITTREQLTDLAAELERQGRFALDTETIGLGHRAKLCGLSVAWQSGQGIYVPICSPDPSVHLTLDDVLQGLRPVLENPAVAKVGHNIKYDLLVLAHAGVKVRGVVFDSMIASHLAGEPAHGMDALALRLLHHRTIPISDLIGARGRGKNHGQATMDQVELDRITQYAGEDADITLRLCDKLEKTLEEMKLGDLSRRVEMPLVEVLAEMEFAGIKLDPQVLSQQAGELQGRIESLKAEICEAAGEVFNMDSPRQLAQLLFEKLKLPVIKRTQSGPSTDIEVLQALCDKDELGAEQLRIPRLMVEYRQLSKLVNTYLESLREAIDPSTGRVHATFHQMGAVTGRLSSSGPNLQNIPIRTEIGRQIRKAFVAEPGCQLISADYSQIELRMLAHLSGDEALIAAFEQDADIHTAVAAQVFNVPHDQVTKEQRGHAKVINFGIIYGVTPYGLSRRIENLSVSDARVLISDYHRRFPGIAAFLQQCVAQAKETGHVTTMLGRRRPVTMIHSKNPSQRALGERLAINTVVQGSAAELIKLAMVNLHRRITREQLPMKLLLQIHDELVAEAPAEQAQAMSSIVQQEMEQAMQLRVPLKVEVGAGPNWFEAK